MSIYEELGVKRIINAAAAQTLLGGSLMPDAVLASMTDAASAFVDLSELHDRVGERLAELTRNEAACISSGAAAGILLAVAACMTGPDPARRPSLPDLASVSRQEVLVFHGQKNGFLSAASQTGANLVEVGPNAEDLAGRITDHTACVIWFAADIFAEGAPPLDKVVQIAHAHNVPVIVDAAAQIPPVSNLWHYTRDLGADIAIFSGGKGLRGPQSSGLVLGRRELIRACRDHAGPYHGLGRPSKVGKEEMIGLLSAVELTLSLDETAVLANYKTLCQIWMGGLTEIPNIAIELVESSAVGQPIPHVIIRLKPEGQWTQENLTAALWGGDPRVAVTAVGTDGIALNPEFISDGEETMVLEKLHFLLTEVPSASVDAG